MIMLEQNLLSYPVVKCLELRNNFFAERSTNVFPFAGLVGSVVAVLESYINALKLLGWCVHAVCSELSSAESSNNSL